ncbi:MAG: glutamate synthase-related protein [Planctomycetota bacterium]
MIEIKLSQGAKPGHGGILPASKVTEEIAEIRHVPLGSDRLVAARAQRLRQPLRLLQAAVDHRVAPPVRRQTGRDQTCGLLYRLCMATATGWHPDFITVDGGEGGHRAAPLEFSNSVACRLNEGLVFVHNCLVGFGLRQ